MVETFHPLRHQLERLPYRFTVTPRRDGDLGSGRPVRSRVVDADPSGDLLGGNKISGEKGAAVAAGGHGQTFHALSKHC